MWTYSSCNPACDRDVFASPVRLIPKDSLSTIGKLIVAEYSNKILKYPKYDGTGISREVFMVCYAITVTLSPRRWTLREGMTRSTSIFHSRASVLDSSRSSCFSTWTPDLLFLIVSTSDPFLCTIILYQLWLQLRFILIAACWDGGFHGRRLIWPDWCIKVHFKTGKSY